PNIDGLTKVIDIGQPCGPSGLAINPKTNIAFLACGGARSTHPIALYMDLKTLKIAGKSEANGGGDSATYDPVANMFFFNASGVDGQNKLNVFSGGSSLTTLL